MKIRAIFFLLFLSSMFVPVPITAAPVKTFLPVIMREYETCTFKPTLLSPADESNLTTVAPLFRWDNGNVYPPGATNLHLDISKNPDFLSPYGLSLVGSASPGIWEFRFTTNLDPATTYYWRASYVCGSKQAPYSEAWSFTTGSGGTFPPGPELISPANGVILQQGSSLVLVWGAAAGAVDYLVAYRPLGQEGYGFKFVDATQTLLVVDTTYEWWVTARNDYGLGAESEHRTIYAVP